MPEPSVAIVHLRRPTSKAGEMRSDPYWEVGSFGCTKCHAKNLMHPKNKSKLIGSRLAFAQGGGAGFRLILLTPPITITEWAPDLCEARWKPAHKPFKYHTAPLLICNTGETDFPRLRPLIEARRSTLEGAFSSRFRSRTQPVSRHIGEEIIAIFDEKRSAAPRSAFATSYVDALPYEPPTIELNRLQNYQNRLAKLAAEQCQNAEMRIDRRPRLRAASVRSPRDASCRTAHVPEMGGRSRRARSRNRG